MDGNLGIDMVPHNKEEVEEEGKKGNWDAGGEKEEWTSLKKTSQSVLIFCKDNIYIPETG